MAADLLALSDLSRELLLADLLGLSQRDVEGLGADHLAVELRDGLGSLVGRRVADEAEALGRALVVLHDAARSDGAERRELGSDLLVIPEQNGLSCQCQHH